MGAVNGAQSLVDVAQADPVAQRVLEPLLGHAEAVVAHFDDDVLVADHRADRNASAADFPCKPVLDRILHQRLQQHARHDHVERLGADPLVDTQLRTESDDLDVEVLVHRLELFAQRHEMIGAAHQSPEETRELRDQHARRFRLGPDQRRDRGQRIEQEMRIDLIGERFDLGGEQQFFLLLQPMLDARVVPDFDRRRDAEHGREQHEQHRPRPRRRRRQHEQPMVIGPAESERLREQLERDRREQQHDLPVDFEGPHHLPDAPRDTREDEGREMPDRFLRTQLAQPAAGEAAADREGQGDPLAVRQRRQADERADGDSGIRTVDQARQE